MLTKETLVFLKAKLGKELTDQNNHVFDLKTRLLATGCTDVQNRLSVAIVERDKTKTALNEIDETLKKY